MEELYDEILASDGKSQFIELISRDFHCQRSYVFSGWIEHNESILSELGLRKVSEFKDRWQYGEWHSVERIAVDDEMKCYE